MFAKRLRNPVKESPTKPTVLVVDDSPEILRYLRVLLESESYQVETAGTGMDAVRRIRSGCTPSVVLLDLQMPGMDGLKTLQSLLRLRPKLKVIMCSGSDDPHYKEQARALGAEGFVTKPVEHLRLSAALERCLTRTVAIK